MGTEQTREEQQKEREEEKNRNERLGGDVIFHRVSEEEVQRFLQRTGKQKKKDK